MMNDERTKDGQGNEGEKRNSFPDANLKIPLQCHRPCNSAINRVSRGSTEGSTGTGGGMETTCLAASITLADK